MALPPSAALVPPWLIRLGALSWRLLVVVALAGVLLWFVFVIGVVSAAIVIAVVIAATFAPLVLALRRRGWSRALAAAAVTGGAILIIGAVTVIIALAFWPYIGNVASSVSAGVADVQALIPSTLPPQIASGIAEAEGAIKSWLAANIGAIAGAIADVVTILILATFLVFFLLLDGDKAWSSMLAATSDWRRDRIESSGKDALGRVGGYLRGMAVIAAVSAITSFVFLTVLGVPLAAPLAILVFLGGFIPYVGGAVSTAILLLVTYATVGAQAAVILFILILIVDLLEGRLITPYVYGHAVSIHPALVLIALPAGAAVAGIVGIFAAVPVVAFALAVTGSIIAALGVREPEPDMSPEVPIWLDRLGQWSWRLLAAIGVLAVALGIAVQVPTVVVPMVLGVILAATFSPAVNGLIGRGWGKSLAALAVTGGAFLIFVVVIVIATIQLLGPMVDAVNSMVAGNQAASDEGFSFESLAEQLGGLVGGGIATLASNLMTVGVIVILGVLLTFYFLRDGNRVWNKFIGRAAGWRRDELDRSGRRIVTILGGYMIGTGAVSLVGAISQFLIMIILGIPYALPVAILSFFLGFIPYIGGFITTGIAFLLTVAYGTTTDVVIMAIYTVVFNIVQGNIVGPLVYGRAVQLHPAVVLLAVPAGAALAGILGMFLIVPLLGVFAATWRTAIRLAGDQPPPELAVGDEPKEPARPPLTSTDPGVEGA